MGYVSGLGDRGEWVHMHVGVFGQGMCPSAVIVIIPLSSSFPINTHLTILIIQKQTCHIGPLLVTLLDNFVYLCPLSKNAVTAFQITCKLLFYLERFLKKLADDQRSSVTKRSIYYMKHMCIQPLSLEVDWPDIWCLIEVSTVCFIFAHTAFLLGMADLHPNSKTTNSRGPTQIKYFKQLRLQIFETYPEKDSTLQAKHTLNEDFGCVL